MALSFSIGTKVALVAPVLSGTIMQATIVGSDIQYLVDYNDAAGSPCTRWFSEAELNTEAEAIALLNGAVVSLAPPVAAPAAQPVAGA